MNVALRRPSDGSVGAPRAGAAKNANGVRQDIASLLAVVLRLIDQHGTVVIYFTAVSHGAGTSTIARELATTAALSDWCKVALIDANLDTNGSHRENPVLGLLDVAADDTDLAFRRSWVGSSELMEGVLVGSNTSAPSVEAVRGLFGRLRSRFTLIIVDGPPIAAARHAAAFSAAADCVVLVVEAERTRAADLERTTAILARLGANVIGVVLNKRRSWIPRGLSRLLWGKEP